MNQTYMFYPQTIYLSIKIKLYLFKMRIKYVIFISPLLPNILLEDVSREAEEGQIITHDINQ